MEPAATDWKTALGNGSVDNKLVAGYTLDSITRERTYTEVMWLIMRGEFPDPEERAVFDACLTAIVDHGYRNTVATVARFAASAVGEPIPAIVAGISAIGRHTAGAQAFVVTYLAEIDRRVAEGEELDAVADDIVRRERERGAVPGFGTKLHREVGFDQRSRTLFSVADSHTLASRNGTIGYRAVGDALERALGRRLVENIDGAMGAVFHDLGFTPTQVAALEVVVMMPSILGHTLEELRDGHPMRLLPDELVRYVGPQERSR